MNIKVYNIFHHKVFDETVSGIPEEERKNIVFWGVNETFPKEYNPNGKYTVIMEKDLPHYRPDLQERKYCQTTCMYHVYKNKLYENLDYIGFAQYDMRFPCNFFANINSLVEQNKDKRIIFGCNLKDKSEILRYCKGVFEIKYEGCSTPIAMDHYNAYFGTNFKVSDIKGSCLPYNHTFVIPRDMFAKMMSWICAYLDELDKPNAKYPSNMSPPEFLERCHAMFLALEYMHDSTNIMLHDMGVRHDHILKNKTDHAWYAELQHYDKM